MAKCQMWWGSLKGRDIGSWLVRLAQTRAKEILTGKGLFPYSHTFLIYDFSVSSEPYRWEGEYAGEHYCHTFSQHVYCFESRFGRNWNVLLGRIGKNGPRGPMRLSALMRSADVKQISKLRIPHVPGLVDKSLAYLFYARDHFNYAPPIQFLSHTLKLWHECGASPERVHCSELGVRALMNVGHPLIFRAFQMSNRTADQFTPRFGYQAIKRLQELARGATEV